MTLREGVCSNRHSTVIWEEEGAWPNRHITFIVAKKLNLQFNLLYLRYMLGEGLVENVIWSGRDWLKTSEYRHIGRRGFKIAQKNVI